VTQSRSFRRRYSQPITWQTKQYWKIHKLHVNTTPKSKQCKIQQNKDTVASYDTRPGNETGLFTMLPSPHRAISLVNINMWQQSLSISVILRAHTYKLLTTRIPLQKWCLLFSSTEVCKKNEWSTYCKEQWPRLHSYLIHSAPYTGTFHGHLWTY